MACLKIVNGPSKWDLMLSLFDDGNPHRRKVTFFLEDPREKAKEPRLQVLLVLEFIIDKLERAAGRRSEGKWDFGGFYLKNDDHYEYARGSFSTKNRKGWVELR